MRILRQETHSLGPRACSCSKRHSSQQKGKRHSLKLRACSPHPRTSLYFERESLPKTKMLCRALKQQRGSFGRSSSLRSAINRDLTFLHWRMRSENETKRKHGSC